jgi:hypothetical protein
MTGVLGYLRRHHVGLLALFVALGGTSYAAANLPRNSVGTAQLRSRAVTGAKLANNAVTATKVKKGSLLAGDFKTGQVPPGPAGPAGPQGAVGRTGATGPTGPSTGRAGGALTGSYPNPTLASGSVNTSNFASGAEAPNAALLAGEPSTHYLTFGNDGQAGAVPISTFGYFMNTSTTSTYAFQSVAIKTFGTSGEFEFCGNSPALGSFPYVTYVNGTRSTGTLAYFGGCVTRTVGAGGDFTISAARTLIFGVHSGDSTTDENYDIYGFLQP